MSWALDLVAPAALASISWIALRTSDRWWQPNRRRKVMWRMDIGRSRQPSLIIDSVDGGSTEHYQRPSTGLGAAISAALVVNSLNSAQVALLRRYQLQRQEPIETLLSTDSLAMSRCEGCDTVVIGGPKNNSFAAAYLQRVGCQGQSDLAEATGKCLGSGNRIGLATEGNTIWWYGQPFQGTVSASRTDSLAFFNGTDYGVIVRSFSHMSSGTRPTRTVLLFGSQTFGVVGATRYLTEAMNLRKSTFGRERQLYKALKRSRNIAVLVSAEVKAGRVLQGRLVDFRVLGPETGRMSDFD
jgi:hypothetical protein